MTPCQRMTIGFLPEKAGISLLSTVPYLYDL